MNTESARRQMVEQQMRTWDVFDPNVLETFESIPKDRYVPESCTDVAYADTEIPLPHGQCMLRANIVGRMIQALAIDATDDVLEIGTGSGYLTACLASLAANVTSIDIFEDFIASAGERLEEQDNVSLACMDATAELPDGEFDVIVVTASMPELDSRMTDKLRAGGRMFVVLGEGPVMTATLVTRNGAGELAEEALFETSVPASDRVREAGRIFVLKRNHAARRGIISCVSLRPGPVICGRTWQRLARLILTDLVI